MIYITADTHFRHKKIVSIANRPFPTVAEHDEYILEGINSRAKKGDTLYVVGDFSMGGAHEIKNKIRCKDVRLIIGNHDSPSTIAAFKHAWLGRNVKLGPYNCWLHHYPTAFWPKSHRGGMHCYGHTHYQREEWLDKQLPGRRSMDVGLDNAFKILGDYLPFNEEEIVEILMARPGHDLIEFYEEQQKNWTPIVLPRKAP